jgi:hypothetical protein
MAPALGAGIISVQIRILRLPVTSLAHLTQKSQTLIILRQTNQNNVSDSKVQKGR